MTWDDYSPARGPILVPTLFAAGPCQGAAHWHGGGQGEVHHLPRHRRVRHVGARGARRRRRRGVACPRRSARGPICCSSTCPTSTSSATPRSGCRTPYLDAVRRADAAVGRIVAALPADTTIIVTADHGGRPEGHGSDSPQDTHHSVGDRRTVHRARQAAQRPASARWTRPPPRRSSWASRCSPTRRAPRLRRVRQQVGAAFRRPMQPAPG